MWIVCCLVVCVVVCHFQQIASEELKYMTAITLKAPSFRVNKTKQNIYDTSPSSKPRCMHAPIIVHWHYSITPNAVSHTRIHVEDFADSYKLLNLLSRSHYLSLSLLFFSLCSHPHISSTITMLMCFTCTENENSLTGWRHWVLRRLKSAFYLLFVCFVYFFTIFRARFQLLQQNQK